jgi:predicted RNA-binding Zn-ribbon protein involved in translation (DUF1610 family)
MGFLKKRAVEPEPVIDLRDPPQPPRREFGKPTRCPQCGEPGYLDRIDVRNRVMHQRCPNCWHRWVTSEAEPAEIDLTDGRLSSETTTARP